MTLSNTNLEAWRDRARDADILEVALRQPCSAKIKRAGREWIGACPACGGDDRFSVNPAKGVFFCRGALGGGVITMVMHVCSVEFLAACEIINGEPPPSGVSQVSAEELAKQEREREEDRQRKQKERAAENARYREKERRNAFRIWRGGVAPEGTPVEQYHAKRGLVIPSGISGKRVRAVPQLGYWHSKKGSNEPDLLHSGWAMLLPIIRGGRFSGVHCSYIDLAQPKGKVRLLDPQDGKVLDPKKVRGSQQGGHIEVVPCENPTRLIIGEGYEKVVAVWLAMSQTGEDDLSSTAFWTSINLGNLGGKHLRTVRHPTLKTESGRASSVMGPEPDLNEPGIEIPDSVTEITILGDRSSDEFLTRCTIARAAKRWERAGRTVRVAWSPADGDFDDLLREQPGQESCQTIADTIFAAQPAEAVDVGAHEPQAQKTSRRQARPLGLSSPAANEQQNPPVTATSQVLENASSGAQAAGGAAAPPARPRLRVISNEQPSQVGRSADDQDASGGGGGHGGGRPGDDDDLNRRCAWFPQTDLGNAERFVARQQDSLIFCEPIGWLWWDGKRWNREGADQRVKRAEHETVRGIQDEARAVFAQSERENGKKKEDLADLSKQLFVWGRKSEANSKIVAVAKNAIAYLEVMASDLDKDAYAFNVQNGTIVARRTWSDGEGDDWRRHGDYIRLKPHDPKDLITKISPVEFNPEAGRAQFDRFLSEVQPDAEMRRFLQQWKGYSLTADTGEHCMALFIGQGRNGKSVLEDATAFVAGDYAETVPVETFVASGREANANAPSPARALLHGARMVRTSEPSQGSSLDEGFIKLVTGGEPITARNLNMPIIRFYPAFKLSLSGNHTPKVRGADEGIWSRIKKVPWEIIIPPEKRDRNLTQKLRGEAAGILNWMLDGLSDWIENGLVYPEKVLEATAEYRRDSDQLGRFLESCVEADPAGRVQSSVLLTVFNAWARANGATEWKGRGFADAMTERGFKKDKSSVMFWVGIRLLKSESDFGGLGGRVDPSPSTPPASGGAKGGLDDEIAF